MHTIYYWISLVALSVVFAACGSTQKAQDSLSLTHEAGWNWDGGQPYHLTFSTEDKLNLKLDVNSCFGGYTVQGNTLTVSPEMGCTEACCDKPEGIQLSRDLMNVTSFQISGSKLTLKTAQKSLVFTAKDKS